MLTPRKQICRSVAADVDSTTCSIIAQLVIWDVYLQVNSPLLMSLFAWLVQVKGTELNSPEEKSAVPEADTISAAAAMDPPMGAGTGKPTNTLFSPYWLLHMTCCMHCSAPHVVLLSKLCCKQWELQVTLFAHGDLFLPECRFVS